jgi:hypothetical protein
MPAIDGIADKAARAGLHVTATVMAGDFNVDMNTKAAALKATVLLTAMQAYGYLLASNPKDPTTELGSHLDSIWVKALSVEQGPFMQAAVSTTYWSDHYLS